MKKELILIAAASLIAWGCNPEKKEEKPAAKCCCSESAAQVENKTQEMLQQSTSASEVKAPEMKQEVAPVETVKVQEALPAASTAMAQPEVK